MQASAHPPVQAILDDGYVTGTLPTTSVARARTLLVEYLSAIPERLEHAQFEPGTASRGDYSAGRFGALNYASAYHNPAAVYIDEMALEHIGPVVGAVARHMKLSYVELIPDRVHYRTQPQVVKSYHTDHTSGAESEDEVFFVAVVNLNAREPRPFTLVPGTHKMSARLCGGDFTPEGNQEQWAQREKTVQIPPGGYALVVENIVHRISGRRGCVSMGKFCGFRISNSSTQWMPENDARMETQAALIHKGGQTAPMVPRLWTVNWPDKCIAYALKHVEKMRRSHTYKAGKRRGQTITTMEAIPLSLAALSCKYPQSASARNRFKPQKVQPKAQP